MRAKHGPEWFIQRDLVKYLKSRNWLVERMIGNAFQTGIPDLYCFRKDAGHRWVDVKNPKSYSFTKAQKIKWPHWESHGLGVWILTGADQENYDKLFGPPNWLEYWKDKWALPTNEEIEQLLGDIE
jgi:hypothetical protein